MNFGFLPEENGIFYFHSAKEGTKLDLLRKNPEVSFELDTSHAVKKGRFACEYSFYYQSVIGIGKVQFVEEPAQKEKALSLLMKQYSTEQNFSFSPESLAHTVILKMTVESISCKEYLPPQS
jgi:nitroimidazol reductase NimA-like FMN-containing flavoprotein (pyridoxamine 5'-phosphate oxidase superfamily)